MNDVLKERTFTREDEAGFLSKMTFGWLDTMIKKGCLESLTIDDIEPLSREDCAETQADILDKNWRYERYGRQSLLIAMFKSLWMIICTAGVFVMGITLLNLLSPVVLNYLIQFLMDSQGEEPPGMWVGLVLATLLFVIAAVKVVLDTQHFYLLGRADIRAKVALKSMIYAKMLELSGSARKIHGVGEISSYISLDVQHIGRWIYVLHDAWEIPLVILSSLALSYYYIGWAAFAGLGVMLVVSPIASLLASQITKMADRVLKSKDARARATNEFLKNVRVIKSFGLEGSFRHKIELLRWNEFKKLIVLSIIETLEFTVLNSIPIVASLVTFGIFGVSGGVLTSANVFTTLALLNKSKERIGKIPHFVFATTKGVVSIERIRKFLLADKMTGGTIQINKPSNNAIELEEATFSWTLNGEPVLHDLNLSIPPGQLVTVLGEVGAGKSALLNCIFRELPQLNGTLTVNGRIAYCAQEPWILNATLRDNILCGKSFDQGKWNTIIRCCALQPDLDALPAGEFTEIGEKGINLSGGQKWRVSLARACYQDSDIYLLDSPLSAVDVHVGWTIFNECICGYLKDKTRILVTQNTTEEFLGRSNQILLLEKGEQVFTGDLDALKKSPYSFQWIQKELHDPKPKSKKETVLKDELIETEAVILPGQLTRIEEKKEGQISLSVIFSYFKGYTTPALVIIALCGFGNQYFHLLSDIWLTVWTSSSIEPDPGVWFYIYAYILIAVFGILASAGLSFSFLVGSLLSSSNLHSKMLTCITKAPISHFDAVPTGRILSRFSSDQNTLDVNLPSDSLNVYLNIMQLVGIFLVIVYVTPWFLIPIVPIAFTYYVHQASYRQCSREIARLKNITKSPILNHVSGSVGGLTSIHAFDFGNRFLQKHYENVNLQGKTEWCAALLSRWLAFRLEFTASLIILFASMFAIFGRFTLNPSLVGLSITYALSLTHILNWFIKCVTQMEQDLVCAERVMEYTTIASEKYNPEMPDPRLTSEWPTSGAISFQNCKMRYREDLENALDGISFEIKPMEKVGICGRTGAGKSSIALVLFRIFELNEGAVFVDGIDISRIPLLTLRNRICIIPQDPVIFDDTVRKNIDPSGIHSDQEIWDVLSDLKGMKELIESFPQKLSEMLHEDGSNLSVGQKQLLCLCRGILKKSRIIVLDEATANIDHEADQVIQSIIKDKFSSCTVITIAHRINTILDYDKILVIESGKVIENGNPSALRKDPTSHFAQLLK